VSLFGAGLPIRTGWADVGAAFERVVAQFTDSLDYRFRARGNADGDPLSVRPVTDRATNLRHRIEALVRRAGGS
jgi:hypothetical protein